MYIGQWQFEHMKCKNYWLENNQDLLKNINPWCWVAWLSLMMLSCDCIFCFRVMSHPIRGQCLVHMIYPDKSGPCIQMGLGACQIFGEQASKEVRLSSKLLQVIWKIKGFIPNVHCFFCTLCHICIYLFTFSPRSEA